jgi:hypothetical protein
MATNAKKRNRYAGKGKNKRKKSNLSTGRDYSYDKEYQKSAKQKKNRAARNKARKEAVKKGKVKVGDRSRDVDHKKPLGKGGSRKTSNTRVMSSSRNRAKK